MTVIGLDDTDSRTLGMCTTYVASRLASQLADSGASIARLILVRLNPAVEHKTRGNAALAIHTDASPERALQLGSEILDLAATDDEQTNPGLVVADVDPTNVPDSVSQFAERAVRDYCDPERARRVCSNSGFHVRTRGSGRGVVGALAAAGAWAAFDDWTYECIAYRERKRWGTERDVDEQSLFEAADWGYPTVWDTVDREEDVAVCVPRTPCPILHGIRGDDPEAVCDVSRRIESEPVDHRRLFVTNQGTDAHLQPGTLDSVEDGRAYCVDATVKTTPETREGGHVFFELQDVDASIQAAAFEPTKRFRDRVRTLRAGDRITACGEFDEGTLKLEKFAVRDLVETERVTPQCPECDRTMESAGRNAGYRCRECDTASDGKAVRELDRTLEEGWYEVPPCARRHIAKPLVRGGFDAPTHPER